MGWVIGRSSEGRVDKEWKEKFVGMKGSDCGQRHLGFVIEGLQLGSGQPMVMVF